jgi:GT2 family glycosyltransferase
VLNYNGKNFLLKCLQSLIDFTDYPSYEILVIDNASTDGSVQEVRRVFGGFKKIKLISLKRNFGYAEGNNIGYKNASREAKYIVFLNNDVFVEKGWLKNLVRALEKFQDIGAAQPIILGGKNPSEECYGYNMDVFGNVKSLYQVKATPQSVYNECFTVLGAAFITRREIIDKIGLFNPNFFLYYEEADFCWRLRLTGFKVVAIHASKVHHIYEATTKKYKTSLNLHFHFCKNKIYTMFLNYQLRNILKYIPWVILSNLSDMVAYILISFFEKENQGKIIAKSCAIGEITSLCYILIHFPDIWKQRMNIQTNIRVKSDSEIIGKFIVEPKPLIPETIIRKIRKMATFPKIQIP